MTAGMSPLCNISDAITQVTLMGFLRFISLFYLNDWWNIISQYRDEKKKTEKKD